MSTTDDLIMLLHNIEVYEKDAEIVRLRARVAEAEQERDAAITKAEVAIGDARSAEQECEAAVRAADTLRARLAQVDRERDFSDACRVADVESLQEMIADFRTRVAALEAAMPSDDEHAALESCITGHTPWRESFERAGAWLTRLDAARAKGVV